MFGFIQCSFQMNNPNLYIFSQLLVPVFQMNSGTMVGNIPREISTACLFSSCLFFNFSWTESEPESCSYFLRKSEPHYYNFTLYQHLIRDQF